MVDLTVSQATRKFCLSLAGAFLYGGTSNYWLQFERRVVGCHAPILAFTICSQVFNNLFIENLQFIQIPKITGFYQSRHACPSVIMHNNIATILCKFLIFFSHFLLTNYPDCDIIDTERGENKTPRKRD